MNVNQDLEPADLEPQHLQPLADGNHDVVVIGAGPVGLALTALLAAKGVRVALVDPNRIVCQHPRATHIDGETARLLQTVGAADLEPNFLRTRGHAVKAADGTSVVEFRFSAEAGDQGWLNDYQIHQPDFESRIRGRLSTQPHVSLWLGWKATAVQQASEHAVVTVTDRESAQTRTLRAGYVVGADGAGSFVQPFMDTSVEDLNGSQRSLIIDIHAFKPAAGLDPAVGFIISSKDRPFTYVPIQPPMLRFELMLRDADDAAEAGRPANVYRFLSPWLEPGDYRIMRTDAYQWHSRLVHGWRDGRLLLAGDAAHTMPPMLGQGMCSGLRDAANLAWKLALVVHGASEAALLDTYESERSAHVRPFIAESASQANLIETFELDTAGPVAAEPREFEQPRPPLGPGLLDPGLADRAVLAPQPRADDGSLFDDIAGYDFAVYTTAAIAGAVDDDTRKAWHDLGAVTVTAPSAELAHWCRDHGCDALIVRPDRYLYAATSGPAELRQASLALRDRLLVPKGAR
jgi:3-(3-hydroxy-phenyl)propionate hydroxylase